MLPVDSTCSWPTIGPRVISLWNSMMLTHGPKNSVVTTPSPAASRRMSSCRYRWWRSAPETSTCTDLSSSATVVSWATRRRSGTMLDTAPPERRMAAVVRAVTGRLRITSSAPVICAR
ncbi:Uncharacterised protein [Mycobacteroides abscessus subsp. abscessus]|nr:Uncharacterised protein [Mycobacteroides abscessus subsp. abscessus]